MRGKELMAVANGPIIVVSDTHIGLQKSTPKRFAHFLEWLKKGLKTGTLPIVTLAGERENADPPEKLILLGDLFELWESRAADYANPVLDGSGVLDTLAHLPCDKIYVPGNHDDTAARYFKIDAVQNGHDFKVTPKHYPEQKEGERIGNMTYFFLHGHRFSRLWTPGVLKSFDFVRRSAYKAHEASPRTLRVGISVFGLVVILAQFSALGALWANLLRRLPAFVVFLLTVGTIVGWIVSAILAFAQVWRWLQRLWYTVNSERPSPLTERRFLNRVVGTLKYLNVGDLINLHYYRQVKDTIAADVVVFGHTHIPEISPPNADGTGKRFVNTGSWLKSNVLAYDTFAYIGEDGPRLLRWDDRARIAREFERSS
jgi:UDP-2,3-diacylglucosamine pyrophosphatase LpxH